MHNADKSKTINRKQYKSVRDALDTGSFSWRPSERPHARSFHRLKLYFDELVVKASEISDPELWDGSLKQELLERGKTEDQADSEIEQRQQESISRMDKVLREVSPSITAAHLDEIAARLFFNKSMLYYGDSFRLVLLKAGRKIRDTRDIPENPRLGKKLLPIHIRANFDYE